MESNQASDKDNPEEDQFYFETDHLALRGNKDYSEVLKTLLILCSQRERAIKDYSKVVELKKEALEDPASVLDKIIKGHSLGLPDLSCVPDIPKIDWSKYDVKVPEETVQLIYADTTSPSKNNQEQFINKESKLSNGRWTTEEQKRLEELLQIYPPEPVEMRRFKKIADALGNRTIQQVSSRVQKYFLKLYKAGLPIPGRIPKSADRHKKSSLHKHQRHNHYLWKPTTFFPELTVPVVMNELENVPGPSSITSNSRQHTSSPNYLIPSNYHAVTDQMQRKTPEELQLDLIKRIKKEKMKESGSYKGSSYHHIGFRCDFCEDEPIVGTRWHCITCQNDSVDFCTDCLLAQIYSEHCHPLSHAFVSYTNLDNDCLSDSGSNPGSSHVNNYSSDDSDFVEENDDDKAASDFSETNLEKQLEDARSNEVDQSFWPGLDTETEFNEVDNVSYKYLHSNLSLD